VSETGLEELQQKISYTFQNTRFLEEASRHSSFVNEQHNTDMRDNERLEFLGDAVLNLVIGDLLMKRHPDLKEGSLSRMRANLVNESQLASIARNLNLGSYLQLGKGEIQTLGKEKNSILAGALEAVIAAVYLDGGFEAAYQLIDSHFASLPDVMVPPTVTLDHKSRIQELTQMSSGEIPVYTVIDEIGPDHDKTFRVRLSLSNLEAEGVGKSKKAAEQDAARKGLEMLNAPEA
jgi:ribonuclease-3